MDNLDFLFEKDIYGFEKPSIRRVIASDDPSYLSPETANYRQKNAPSGNAPVMTPMSLESDRSELATMAEQSLSEAVEHLEVDQKVENALKTIIEELDKKSKTYHEKHPIPGEKPSLLKEPDWAKAAKIDDIFKLTGKKKRDLPKLKQTHPSIARVGSAPKEEEPIIISELKMKVKALNEGMTVEEIKSTDIVLDRAFDCKKGGFHKKF